MMEYRCILVLNSLTKIYLRSHDILEKVPSPVYASDTDNTNWATDFIIKGFCDLFLVNQLSGDRHSSLKLAKMIDEVLF